MNKREKRLLAIYENRLNESVDSFTTQQLVKRVREQDYCYTEAMRRFDNFFMRRMIKEGIKFQNEQN